MTESPRVSVIIRAYNAESTIARAVESALGQDFPRDAFEVVVVNDGSTDHTRAILVQHAAFTPIRVYDQENQGAVAAANAGIAKSRGDYVVFLDSDDLFLPNLLNALTRVLDAHPEVDFVYPDYYERQEDRERLVSPRNIFENVMIGVLFRKQRLREVGGYRPEILMFPEYDLFLRIADTWKAYHYPQPLFVYCRRRGSLTDDPHRVAAAFEQLRALHPGQEARIEQIRSY